MAAGKLPAGNQTHEVTFVVPTERLEELGDWLDEMAPNWQPPIFYRTPRLFKKHLKNLTSSFYNYHPGILRMVTVTNLSSDELMLSKLTWDILSHS